jgi:glycerophosphoryl diester phosphodiesterase
MNNTSRHIRYILLFFATGCFMSACTSSKITSPAAALPSFAKEGHRGTRGLMPENTIPSMTRAIAEGANIIEVDIYTSRDGQVIVTHDAFINREFSLLPDGQEIPQEDAKKYIVHQMDYAEIRAFDVGTKYYSAYPQQKKIRTYIPLFAELIDSVEQYTATHKLPRTIYNIELKTSVKNDSVYNAKPKELVDAVMKIVRQKNLGNRFYIQSFDVRPLQVVHQDYPDVAIGFLTNSKKTMTENIQELGFYPHIYSPQYELVTPEMVQACKARHMRLIPWTVNTTEEMKALIDLGVDGIITDYPDLLTALKK